MKTSSTSNSERLAKEYSYLDFALLDEAEIKLALAISKASKGAVIKRKSLGTKGLTKKLNEAGFDAKEGGCGCFYSFSGGCGGEDRVEVKLSEDKYVVIGPENGGFDGIELSDEFNIFIGNITNMLGSLQSDRNGTSYKERPIEWLTDRLIEAGYEVSVNDNVDELDPKLAHTFTIKHDVYLLGFEKRGSFTRAIRV